MSFSLIHLEEKTYYKSYIVGAIILSLYGLCLTLSYSEIILFFGILSIEFGFIIWAILFYRDKIKGRSLYTFLFGVINLIVLWISNAYAEELVVKSLGFPAEDFGLTLHLLILICYIPAAMIVTIFAFLIAYLILFVSLTLKMLKDIIYSLIYPFLVLWGKKKIGEVEKKNHRLFLHFLAFGVTSVLLGSIFSLIVKHQSSFYPSIRYIAYIVDYQYIYNYPKIDQNKKIKLHANGVFSTMEGHGQNLKIIVRKLDE